MKTILILLLTVLAPAIAFAQETQQYVIADFKGMQCNGDRGVCSFELSIEENANAVLMKNADGTLSLKVFRAKLSPEEEIQLLGEEITTANQNELSFQQPEQHELEPAIKSGLGLDETKDNIDNGSFSAEITEESIIIQLPLR